MYPHAPQVSQYIRVVLGLRSRQEAEQMAHRFHDRPWTALTGKSGGGGDRDRAAKSNPLRVRILPGPFNSYL